MLSNWPTSPGKKPAKKDSFEYRQSLANDRTTRLWNYFFCTCFGSSFHAWIVHKCSHLEIFLRLPPPIVAASLTYCFLRAFSFTLCHSVWKSPKKSHLTLRAKRATFTFWVEKSSLKMPKNGQFGMFWETEATILTVLPDKPILIEQKSIESAKIRYSNATF